MHPTFLVISTFLALAALIGSPWIGLGIPEIVVLFAGSNYVFNRMFVSEVAVA